MKPKPMTQRKRKILIDALVEDWLDSIATGPDGEKIITQWLTEGRVGYTSYPDAALIAECRSNGQDAALEAAGVAT